MFPPSKSLRGKALGGVVGAVPCVGRVVWLSPPAEVEQCGGRAWEGSGLHWTHGRGVRACDRGVWVCVDIILKGVGGCRRSARRRRNGSGAQPRQQRRRQRHRRDGTDSLRRTGRRPRPPWSQAAAAAAAAACTRCCAAGLKGTTIRMAPRSKAPSRRPC